MEFNNQKPQSAFAEFIRAHRWTVTLVVIGLIVCVLLMTIRFWWTLLICAVVGICFFLGRLMDKGGWDMARAFLDRVLPK
ncbi:MAG: DUF2273 domain-containing protein [Clostridiales bacterium]|jgi:uncharacterized membrane protein|nr:DUF2273 domain-containing protein [Clostridiales bacterium]